MADQVTNAINKYGNEIGVAATKGTTFQGMTWAATILMFLAAAAWVVDCCVGRRPGQYGEKGGGY